MSKLSKKCFNWKECRTEDNSLTQDDFYIESSSDDSDDAHSLGKENNANKFIPNTMICIFNIYRTREGSQKGNTKITTI